ncbi:MAG: hypothetical protein JXJ04_24405 [Spirochaetales bacterium]|nr:hypothetical protein [Spirochaetales bacterium]
MYTIADGNGNLYIITTTTVEYTPISPAMSSSGIYSGGEYKKPEITTTQYNQIKHKINSILANKSILINTRIKGSGLITITGANNKKETYLIKPAAPEFTDLEDSLKKIIE